jgi:hypothetical protein
VLVVGGISLALLPASANTLLKKILYAKKPINRVIHSKKGRNEPRKDTLRESKPKATLKMILPSFKSSEYFVYFKKITQ